MDCSYRTSGKKPEASWVVSDTISGGIHGEATSEEEMATIGKQALSCLLSNLQLGT